MKKTSVILILTFCLAFAAMAFSVQADTMPQFSVAAKGGDYTTIEEALTSIEKMAAKGELNSKGVKLVLTGSHTATANNSLLFGQKTIFLPSGKKLPITITGGSLNMPSGNVACANDYTFADIAIPFDDVQTNLFAGSGCVTLSNIQTNLNNTAEYKSCFYGDTFTANVFKGWTEQNLNSYQKNGLFHSSMILGEGMVYESTAYACAAVGASTDFSAQIGTKTVSAANTQAELIIEGAWLKNTLARVGTNPVGNSVLQIKSGSVCNLYALAPSASTKYIGNLTVLVEGGSSSICLLQNCTLKGNLSVSIKNVNLLTNESDAQKIELGNSNTSVLGDISVDMENVKAERYLGSASSNSQKVTGDIKVSAKNCEFTGLFRSGFGQATICGNVENTLENVQIGPAMRGLDQCPVLGKVDEYTGKQQSVGNLTNTLKNVTFAEPASETSIYLGTSGSCTIAGNIQNTVENVTTQGKLTLYLANSSGTVNGDITNTVKSGSFSHYVYGGPYGGTVKGTLRNYINGGTYAYETYLGGYNATFTRKIENHVSGGVFNHYLFCGPRDGKVTKSDNIPYAIENYFTGGSFHGVWGSGENGLSSVLNANVYNEISDGNFGVYNTTDKINSFAGSVRNGTHNANVDTLIRGGTFEGYVFGGAIPHQESWSRSHKGTSRLTLAGGDFHYFLDANCRWGSFDESYLYVNTEKAVEPLSISSDLNLQSFIAASDTIPSILSKHITCKDLISRGKAPLQVLGSVKCDNFIVEAGSASPEIYGIANVKNLNAGSTKITLGAKARINTEAVNGGTVRLEQSEYWMAKTYFTSPANTNILLFLGEKAYGEATAENGVVKGTNSPLEGVSFVFDDTVSLRFYFNKEKVDYFKNDFSFTAFCGENPLIDTIDYTSLVLKDGFYTVLSRPLSATEFCSTITLSSSIFEGRSFTSLQLAETGIQIYGKEGQRSELGNLLKGFSNYAVAADNYKNNKTTPLPYENLAKETKFTPKNGFVPLVDSPWVYLTDKQLILDDGMRVRYYLKSDEISASNKNTLNNNLNKLHYFYNCEDITGKSRKEWKQTGFQKGYYEITIDVPVSPSESKDAFRFIVAEKSSLYDAIPASSTEPYTTYVSVDYIDRLDCVAEQLSQIAESQELGAALLYYLQAGANYYKTQPDLSEFTFPTEFSAGYGREDFSPYGYEMDMYGNRNGKVVLDPMYVTCIALWDGDELALLYSLDVRGVSAEFTVKYKNVLKQELKDLIDVDKIFLNATHNHSGPNASKMNNATVKYWYETTFDNALIMATKKAILDLAPSQLYSGAAMSDPGTNYVRRYVNADGTITGIWNIIPAKNVVGYETEADKELRTMRFTREGKKDIVYVNWQGHVAHGTVFSYQFISDLVGFLRNGVEEDMDVHFIYANGASGNLNSTPKTKADINANYFTAPYFQGVGKSLVGTVKKAIASEEKIQTGKIQLTHIPFLATIKHDDEETVAKAREAQNLLSAYKAEHGTDMPTEEIQKQTGFQSSYEISYVISRAGMGETAIVDAYALSFGDVSMSFVPYEQFDTNAMQIREGVKDLYKMTFTCAYTNGSNGYVPSAYAAPHGGYEVYSCLYTDSTGDDISSALIDALKNHKAN